MTAQKLGRLLGVDFGESRVGLALSDPLRITAQPLQTLERLSDKKLCREIAAIVNEREVVEVVVGMPLDMSGDVGEAAQRVTGFVDRLRNYTRAVVTTQDERLTSVQAEHALRESKMSWRKRRQLVDQVAAALMLQAVLDQRAAGH